MDFKVREGEPSDAPAIGALLKAITPLLVPDPSDPDAAQFLESLREPAVAERLVSANYLHLVAESEGRLCGYIATRERSHLYHLFVLPELHGLGVARLLWRSLIAAGGDRPYTVNSSLQAVPVYRRFGFAVAGEPQLQRCPPFVPMAYPGGP